MIGLILQNYAGINYGVKRYPDEILDVDIRSILFKPFADIIDEEIDVIIIDGGIYKYQNPENLVGLLMLSGAYYPYGDPPNFNYELQIRKGYRIFRIMDNKDIDANIFFEQLPELQTFLEVRDYVMVECIPLNIFFVTKYGYTGNISMILE